MEYIQLHGDLFEQVQLSHIFHDSKTFVDAIPKKSFEEIKREYQSLKSNASFDLDNFVRRNFFIPGNGNGFPDAFAPSRPTGTMFEYIQTLWLNLYRKPDVVSLNASTLIPLPYSYIVPGGRFREVYYWDSFFTMLGLLKSGQNEIALNMCRNFKYLIEKVGHIPNGNRVYFLGRSQPPFLALIIDLITNHVDKGFYKEYLPILEKEYAYWMRGVSEIHELYAASNHVVKLRRDVILNRFYDEFDTPREEAFFEDYHLAMKSSPANPKKLWRDLRAGAESGWDYSSRWFADTNRIATIRTTDIIPVDLNSLLYFMEKKLGSWFQKEGNLMKSKFYLSAAKRRKEIVRDLFWDEERKFFFDYCFTDRNLCDCFSLAAVYPLYFKIATNRQAFYVAEMLKKEFLKKGGLLTTLHYTGEQWDAANGWAPLQWLAIQGLRNYGYYDLANEIKLRWVQMCESVFNSTGKMLEKYNVADAKAGMGGEYALQEGFGWTNGVTLDLMTETEDKNGVKKYFQHSRITDYA